VPVPGARGTLVVWNRLMPHTSLANETDEPRLVQYVTMTPAREEAVAERGANVRGCLEKRPPAWAIRQRVPGQQDPEPGPPVALTALGRALVGIDDWDPPGETAR
jgi:ectoine hydroxylase-related dioxygenase (phytanoyl-CoA dioxygenase family)